MAPPRRRGQERHAGAAHPDGTHRPRHRSGRAGPGQPGLARVPARGVPLPGRSPVGAADHRLAMVEAGYRGHHRGDDPHVRRGPPPVQPGRARSDPHRVRRHPGFRPPATGRADPAHALLRGRYRRPGDRRPSFRERMARHRRSPLGASGAGTWRGGRIHLGINALGFVLLGPSRQPGVVSCRRAGVDGRQSRRHRFPADRSDQNRPAGRALLPDPALRGVSGQRRRLRHVRVSPRCLHLGGQRRSRAGELVPRGGRSTWRRSSS